MRSIVCGLVLVLAAALAPAGARADTIVVLSDFWFPYNGQPKSQREGYKIDLLRHIAKANGHSIDYRLLDWELSLQRTESGQGGDCVVGAIESDAPRHARTARPWGVSENMLYGHIDRMPSVPDLDALRALRIGVVADYSYGDELDALLEEIEDRVTRIQASRRAFPQLVLRLATKQADVIIEDANVARVGLTELGMTETIRAIDVDFLEPDPVYVACTPNERGRRFIALFDAGMEKARADGELQRILDKYSLSDWAGQGGAE